MPLNSWRHIQVANRIKSYSAPIQVRDIVVTQPVGIYGEFQFNHIPNESQQSLLNRILLHIDHMAKIGLEKHLKDNFEHPLEFELPFQLNHHKPLSEHAIQKKISTTQVNALDLKEAELKLRRQYAANLKLTTEEIQLEAAKQYRLKKRAALIEMEIDRLQGHNKSLPRWQFRAQVEAAIPEPGAISSANEAIIAGLSEKELNEAELLLRWHRANQIQIPGEEIIQVALRDKAITDLEKLNSAIEANYRKKLPKSRAKMKEECVNNLTRVILNEFSFYPKASQGPISEANFGELLFSLENLAKRYPANLHLVLASFPVVDAENQIYNMVLYVQCGPHPVITSHNKSNPSHLDPIYPGTRLPFLTRGSIAKQLLETMREIIKQIQEGLNSTAHQVDFDKFAELLKLCRSNPDYDPHIFYFKELSHIEKQIAELKDSHSSSNIKVKLASEILNKMQVYIRELEAKSTLLGMMSAESITHNPGLFAKLPQANGTGRVHAAQVAVETVGGVRASVFIEVCLEHHERVAANKLIASIESNTSANEPITKSISHVIVSNTVRADKTKIVSQHFTHADPEEMEAVSRYDQSTKSITKLPPQESDIVFDTVFGPSVRVSVYPPFTMSELSKQMVSELDEYNKAVAKIRLIKAYYTQHPHEAGKAEREINGVLLAYYALVGDATHVRKLLRRDVDVNVQDENGNTPLHLVLTTKFIVSRATQDEIIRVLSSAGAKLTILNKTNQTALNLIEARSAQDIKIAAKAATTSHPISSYQLFNEKAATKNQINTLQENEMKHKHKP